MVLSEIREGEIGQAPSLSLPAQQRSSAGLCRHRSRRRDPHRRALVRSQGETRMATRPLSAAVMILLSLVLPSAAVAVELAPTVVTASAMLTGATSFSAGGNVTDDGGLPVTQRGICWGSSPNPTTSDSKAPGGTGTGAFTCSAAGLSEASHFYFRAYATNGIGTSYGQQMTIITGSSAVPSYGWRPRHSSRAWSCVASCLDGTRLVAGAFSGASIRRRTAGPPGPSKRRPGPSTGAGNASPRRSTAPGWSPVSSAALCTGPTTGVQPGRNCSR